MDIDANGVNSIETDGRVFSLGQMTLAILIGSPIAGCLLLAQNYRRLGRIDAAWNSIFLGIALTIVVFVIAFLLPDSFPNVVWPMAYTIGMREGIKFLQGDAIANFEAQGQKGSWILAVGVGVGCLILIAALIFGVVFLLFPVL